MAQRISQDGTFVWANPVTVALNGGEQKYVSAALDSESNAIVAWFLSGNIFAQSLTPDGNRRWTDGDVRANAEPDVVEEGYDATFDLDTAPDGSTQPTGEPDLYAINGLSSKLYNRLVVTARDTQGNWSAPESVRINKFLFLPMIRK